MAHEIKRSKISNDLGSSDQPASSLSCDSSSLPDVNSSDFDESRTPTCVVGITSVDQVFGIDWLREEILNYAIHDNSDKISWKLLPAVRLVQKSWLSTATKLIKKCKDPPLIHLILDIENEYSFLMPDDITVKRIILDLFTATFGSSSRLKESFIPFKLKLDWKFFRHENYQSLSNCFTRLGNELLELEIVYPFDGGNVSVNFPPFRFPILRKLTFQFSGNIYEPMFDHPPNFGDNKFGLWLLQSILNASEDLQQLSIPIPGCCPYDTVPATFEFLHLPVTIVSLKLGIKLDSKTLETLFLRNPLPNLHHLMLQFHEEPFENGLMYKILEQFRKTLKSLQIEGDSCYGSPFPRTLLQFPVMEKLEFINILGKECELGRPDKLTSLQECLPKLERMNLCYQTEAMLRKWVGNVKFVKVHELAVSIVNDNLAEEHDNFYRSPSREIMTQLCATFPNVKELLLHFNIRFLNSLECLFRNMKRVEKLELRFHGTFNGNSCNLLDSTLTGMPLSLVGALKRNGVDILGSGSVPGKNDSLSTICNLTELNTLSLVAEDATGQVGTLVSDFLFGQAFLKMPKLCYLYLRRNFEPSVRMQQQWKEQGRFIIYSS